MNCLFRCIRCIGTIYKRATTTFIIGTKNIAWTMFRQKTIMNNVDNLIIGNSAAKLFMSMVLIAKHVLLKMTLGLLSVLFDI